MRVRSWLIRGLILAGIAALVALGWLANSWVSPERVREKVVATLAEQFEDVDVHVGSARMRILGGIAVSDLRLTRRGDPPGQPFLVVPNAILFHDKEQLNRGRLVIRKVQLDNPTIRVERSADGKWNVAEILKPGPADRPVPTFTVQGATAVVIDHSTVGFPPTTFTDVQGTFLNDTLPALSVQATGTAKQYGPVSIRGRLNRINNHLALSVELAEFPVGAAAVSTAQRFAPEVAPHLAKLSAVANVKADLNFAPESIPQWRHDVRFDVKGARFEHPDLPWPIEKIIATVRSVDGRVKVENATAEVGSAKLSVSLETRADAPPPPTPGAPPADDPMRRFEEQLLRLDVTVAGVPLNDALFNRLPESLKKGRRMFSPTGQVDAGYKFVREGAGWKRELEVRPKQAGMTYEKFRYPVTEVGGQIKRTTTHTGTETTLIDLNGTAAGQSISVKGQINGPGPDPEINLRVAGTNVPIDDNLFTALPPKYAAIVRDFRATGRGDFVAKIAQRAGVNMTENEFSIDVKDGKLNYTAFPYPLEKLKGRLVIHSNATETDRPIRPGEQIRPLPDNDEVIFDEFTAVHAGALVRMHGSRRPIPNTRDHKLVIHVGGTKVPLDKDLRTALGTVKADTVWTTFSPTGHMTFAAVVDVLDRGPTAARPDFDPPLDPVTDVKVTFEFSGPTVTPKFFPYELTELAGWLEYKNNRVDLARMSANHGPSRMKLDAGEIRLYPNGAAWANLGGIELKPCIVDETLKKALPGRLGPALDEIQLKGNTELLVKHLVVSAPPDSQPPGALPPGLLPSVNGATNSSLKIGPSLSPGPPPDPIVYWNAELKLLGASLDTGVTWQDAFGSITCRGRYEGTHLGALDGTVWLDRALVARVPVAEARCKVTAEPQKPDPARPGQYLPTTLQFLNVSSDLFSGKLIGEAAVVLTESTSYKVWLVATDVNLEKAARHYNLGSDADLKGIAQARLLLGNKLDPKTGRQVVDGEGTIDVPTGRMYNLPVLLDLMKLFRGSVPDKTAFEQAHVAFRVRGDRIKVDQLDLIGKAICLGGSGELDSSGDYVKFEFYMVWSQLLKQMINTPVGDLNKFLSKNLFTIKMSRENGELKYRPEPVPLVTEPTKAVLDRLKRGAGWLTGK
ncbi:hypothetical protein VT84_02320 [Gemmata sp. SH-PL17]|uniref:hypothetical protein n=1 Tax=Gemmata sp. SH-PL17 TaxID=1630693 RepID=UPI00078E1C94|nr:hypothetical protein [Gemmata sp. SH-PL17]AMV23215.1 hypothetical protein VT84_02320 [Gemmata sp. SH-PL17]